MRASDVLIPPSVSTAESRKGAAAGEHAGVDSYTRSKLEVYDHRGTYDAPDRGEFYAKVEFEAERALDRRRRGPGIKRRPQDLAARQEAKGMRLMRHEPPKLPTPLAGANLTSEFFPIASRFFRILVFDKDIAILEITYRPNIRYNIYKFE